MRNRNYMIFTLILASAMVALLGFSPATTDAKTPTVSQQGAQSTTEQPVTVSIEEIDLDVICVGNNTVRGGLKLSAKYTGSITLVVASHIPPAGNPDGTSDWNRTGGEVTVNFDDKASATFFIPVTKVSGANSYRIEVKGTAPAAGWSVNGTNTKSDSFNCGAESTATPTSTATSLPPTATATVPPPTATATTVPPTATATMAPPTATATVAPPTATAGSTPPSETGNIAVFKSMCNDIGQQDTCGKGHDTSLEGYHVDFQVRTGADASGPVIQTITVTLGDNAGGGGNVANGGMGRSVGSALPVGTYTVCEVPVAYKTGYPNVPLQAFPRPTASQGGSTGGSNQWQTGALCITVKLTPGTAELKFLDVRTQPTATPTATSTTQATTPTATATIVEVTPTATATVVETTLTATATVVEVKPTATGTVVEVTPTATATATVEVTPTATATTPAGETTPTATATATSTATPTATPTSAGGEETPQSTPTATATPVTPTATPTGNGGGSDTPEANNPSPTSTPTPSPGGGGEESQPPAPGTTAAPAAPSGEVAGAAPPPAPQPAAPQPAPPAAPVVPAPEVAGFMPAPPPAMPAPAAPAPEVLPAPPAAAPPAQLPAQLPVARAPQAQPAAPRVLPTTGEANPAAEWEIAALMGMLLFIGGIATMRRRGTQPR